MKNLVSLLVLATMLSSCGSSKSEAPRPRLIVTTDININAGDPDDRQSMTHLFLYADEIDIRGIVIDRPDARGLEATLQVLECYRTDYNAHKNNFTQLGFPTPDELDKKIFRDKEASIDLVIAEALSSDEPLYIAAWGNMNFIRRCLDKEPSIASRLRLLTIGTELKAPSDTENCGERNWNDMNGDRETIYNDERFKDIWWLENNWGYSGMTTGSRPAQYLKELYQYGALGRHMTEAMKHHAWAQYFRVGDTPTVMYFINNPDLNNPAGYHLGGCFKRPYPSERPNYYIDCSPDSEWNYSDPCSSWDMAEREVKLRAAEMEERRDAMYVDFSEKLEMLYAK